MLKWNFGKAAFLGLFLLSCTYQNTNNINVNHGQSADKPTENLPADEVETITLAGGCFWCIEAVFERTKGVYSAVSGYSGGTKATADYKTVCTGQTDHAEVVQIKFNPKEISLAEILDIFWNVHDPTTLNRQGNDVGPQYRSAIFYHTEEQKRIAEESMKNSATQIWDKPIVTQLVPFKAFYEAEDYHQEYFSNVGERNPYCTYVIAPKVQKFQKLFSDKVKQ